MILHELIRGRGENSTEHMELHLAECTSRPSMKRQGPVGARFITSFCHDEKGSMKTLHKRKCWTERVTKTWALQHPAAEHGSWKFHASGYGVWKNSENPDRTAQLTTCQVKLWYFTILQPTTDPVAWLFPVQAGFLFITTAPRRAN